MIIYDKENKKVKQFLDYLPLNFLEGDFDNAMTRLTELKEKLVSLYINQSAELYEHTERYLDGTSEKKVKFDKLIIEIGYFGEEDSNLTIWGERSFLPEELKGLEDIKHKEALQKEEKERALWEELNKKYGKS